MTPGLSGFFYHLNRGIVLSFDACFTVRPHTITYLFTFHMRYQPECLRVRRTSPRVRNSVSHAVSFDNATSARDIFHPSECDTLPFHASSSSYSLLLDTILKQCSYPYIVFIRISRLPVSQQATSARTAHQVYLPCMYHVIYNIYIQSNISILPRKSSLSISRS